MTWTIVRRPRLVLAIPIAAFSAADEAREKSVAWRIRRKRGMARILQCRGADRRGAVCPAGARPPPRRGWLLPGDLSQRRPGALRRPARPLHRLATAEVFHSYLGHPVEMLPLRPDGSHGVTILGSDLDAGQRPQV